VEEHELLKGYELIGSDDAKVGEIVDRAGDILIVEHGTLRKHRNALPTTFVHFDADAGAARTTLSKQMIHVSPEVHEGQPLDEKEIAAYYGLAAGFESPPTLGAGELNPDDPALSADQQARRLGLTPPEEQRARIREGEEDIYGPPGRQIHPADPHVIGEPDR
jgi:hypothetical protein